MISIIGICEERRIKHSNGYLDDVVLRTSGELGVRYVEYCAVEESLCDKLLGSRLGTARIPGTTVAI